MCLLSPRWAAKLAIKIFATPIRIPRPISEKDFFESANKFHLKNGIAAFEWGKPTDPVVFLIHGWNGRGTQLGAFAQPLVKKNFRVIAFDGPGHGDSPGNQTNPKHFAHFIIDAQKEIAPNGIHSVIAHSFGGGCSVLAATLGLQTKSFILIASPAFYEKVVIFFAKSLGLNEKGYQYFIDMITTLTAIHPKDLNIGKLGSKLNLPCLVIHDEGDNAVDVLSAKSINEHWPHSELYLTQGLGHRRILKDPRVLDKVSDFIEKLN